MAPLTVAAPADTRLLARDAAWRPAFPSPDLVRAAAGLLNSVGPWDGREGARARIVVGPGMVQIARRDPARADRAHEGRESGQAHRSRSQLAAEELLLEYSLGEAEAVGLVAAAFGDYDLAAAEADRADSYAHRIELRDTDRVPARGRVVSWSRKSRANMLKKLAALDYGPLFSAGHVPAMLTLTYPGDWQAVVPDAATAQRHVRAFQLRYKRAWNAPLVGVWKREFQERGAPHFHILSTPPRGTVELDGKRVGFRDWLSLTWAAIVAAEHCGQVEPEIVTTSTGRARIGCCERHRHISSGTGVDYAEGMRASDPKRVGIYFSKHGAYSAKEYQNVAPAEWIEAGSVGRFWGVWGLDAVTAAVEVSEPVALAAARTLRRWQAANGYRVQRAVTRVDTRTGVIRTRKSGFWSGSRMRGSAGFVVVNDGPALVSQLSRYLDQVEAAAPRRGLVPVTVSGRPYGVVPGRAQARAAELRRACADGITVERMEIPTARL